MKRFIIYVVCALSFLAYTHSFAADYENLIYGKWIRYEKTKSFDLSGKEFIKSPWYVSYEFMPGNKFIITSKEIVDGPHPFRIVGNVLKYSKEGIKGEMEILELTENTLTVKSPVSISRFKREKK